MKAILAHIAGGDLDEPVLAAALSIARLFGSRIEALHTRLDPSELSLLVNGQSLAASVPELAAAIERDAEQLSRSARTHFDQWRAAHSVADAEAAGTGKGPSALWRETRGAPQRAIARHGRLSDLIVFGRAVDAASGQSRAELEAALFDCGRPVLLVPRGSGAINLGTVMVAWNASLEAARTIGLAMPILAAASRIIVVTAAEGDIAASDSEALAGYLGLHGLQATAQTIEPGGALGERFLDAARNAQADLFVMGAFTRSRMRQLIFGGVTRHMLEAADLPVLMSR